MGGEGEYIYIYFFFFSSLNARYAGAIAVSLWVALIVGFSSLSEFFLGEQVSWKPREVVGDQTTDLGRISDPVNELVAETLVLLDGGVYRVTSPLADGSGETVMFAFKTECRPPSQWHGQQGWPEVAVHHFQQLFYDGDNVDYPKAAPARGVVVAATKKQLLKVARHDKCGLLHAKNVAALEEALGGIKLLRGAKRGGGHGNSGAIELLIGVAITWRGDYDDKVYPAASVYAPYFAVPAHRDNVTPHPVHRHGLYQMSDVFVFDYLVLNPDRLLSKNWFTDTATRQHTVLMDNGWAFAGDDYRLSVCAMESTMLRCPSALQKWSQEKSSPWRCMPNLNPADASTTSPSQHDLLIWCRFRPETLLALARTRARWCDSSHPGGVALSKRWMDKLRSDILIAFLLHAYGNITARGGSNMALGRYLHGCPTIDKWCADDPGEPSPSILRLLEVGLVRRMDRLAAHAEQCARDYGEEYVSWFNVSD